MDNPRLDYLRDKVKKLPLQPGIYIMKDKKGQIIYIGKAKALKNRVSSYFRSVDKHTPKVYRMVENVWDFEYIVTSSEFEAQPGRAWRTGSVSRCGRNRCGK